MTYRAGRHGLGEILRKVRSEKGLLQKDVAKKLGVDEMSYCYWEQEKRHPSLRKADVVREFLGQDTAFLEERYLELKQPVMGIDVLCRRLGVPRQTFASWVHREHFYKPRTNLSGQTWLFTHDEVAKIQKKIAARRNRSP